MQQTPSPKQAAGTNEPTLTPDQVTAVLGGVLVLPEESPGETYDTSVSHHAKNKAERRISQTVLLLAAQRDAEFWHDRTGTAFATVLVDGHYEHHPIRSRAYRDWLTHKFFASEGRAPSANAIEEALRVAEAQALYRGTEYSTGLRVAGKDNIVYYDLCNPAWEIVRITKDGWQIISSAECPIRFIRKRGMSVAPFPKRGGDLSSLYRLLQIHDRDSSVLLTGWLHGCFSPEGPYPILDIKGEQGSGKSFQTRVLRKIIDPNEAPVSRAAKSEDDLLIEATCAWVLAYDNMSGLSDDLSDALCRLATGGGIKKRQLFTDAEIVILEAKRPVILNGIDESTGREDLQDRTIGIRQKRLDDSTRKTEREMWAEFDAIHPEILGRLCDATSSALKNRDGITLSEKPRMLDFAVWVTAAEAEFGWEPEEFLRAYAKNRQQSYRDHVEASPFAQAVIKAVGNGSLEGTAQEWLVWTKDGRPDGYSAWPRTASGVSNSLRRLAPALRKIGYEVTMRRTHSSRLIEVRIDPNFVDAPDAPVTGDR